MDRSRTRRTLLHGAWHDLGTHPCSAHCRPDRFQTPQESVCLFARRVARLCRSELGGTVPGSVNLPHANSLTGYSLQRVDRPFDRAFCASLQSTSDHDRLCCPHALLRIRRPPPRRRSHRVRASQRGTHRRCHHRPGCVVGPALLLRRHRPADHEDRLKRAG